MQNLILTTLVAIGVTLGGLFGLNIHKDTAQTFSAFGDPFLSIQLAPSPSNGYVLTTDGTDNIWSASGGSGETNTASNLGTGLNIFDTKSGVDLRFNSLLAGSNITLSTTTNANTIVINSTASGSGSGNVSTSTGETAGQLAYWTSTNATPALLGKVATTSLTASSPLSLSQAITVIGGTASALSLDTSGDWTGNAGTATALAGNGSNCTTGNYPLGVDASGASEDCTSLLPYAFSWTPTTAWGLLTNATTTQIQINQTLFSSSTIGRLTVGTLTATSTITGTLTGNADTATALSTNGDNCSSGNAPLGVDATGDVENCFDVWTEAENTSAGYTSNTGTVTSIATTFPITGGTITTTGTLGFNGLSTSSPAVIGNIPYFSGVNTFANVATTSVTCSGSASCTPFTIIGASPIVISATAGGGDYAWTPTLLSGITYSATTSPMLFYAPTITSSSTVGYLTTGSLTATTSTATSTFAGGVLLANQAGQVGIGTTTPYLGLTVEGGIYSETLAASLHTFPATLNPGADDISLFYWYPARAAFMAGERNTVLTVTDIGFGSARFGFNTKASGSQSFATGDTTIASGDNSSSFGSGSTASGIESFAIGHSSIASGSYSFAGGTSGQAATGTASFAFGSGDTTAGGGTAGIAMGVEAHAYGDGAVSIGGDANHSFSYCTVLGGVTNRCFPTYSVIVGGADNLISTTGSTNGFSAILAGVNNNIASPRSMTIGNNLTNNAADTITIGSGVIQTYPDGSNTNPLINDQTRAIYMGQNSNLPTFVITQASGAGTIGNVGIGTTSPYAKLSVVGETVASFFTATTTATSTFAGGINSSKQGIFGTGLTVTGGQITAPVGSAGFPSYTFAGDTDTGFHYDGVNTIGVSSGGSKIATLSSALGLVMQSVDITNANSTFSYHIENTDGTVSAPTYSFTGDTNTGSYTPSADILSLVSGGVERLRLTTATSTFAGGLDSGTLISSPYFHATSTTATSTFNYGINLSGGGCYAKGGVCLNELTETLSNKTLNDTTFGGTMDLSAATVTIHQYPSFTYGTSTAWSATTTVPLGPAFTSETWNSVKCFTDVGTLWVAFDDGTNVTNYFQASTTVGTVTLSTNNTFSASEKRYVKVGNPASSPFKISCTIDKIVND